MKKILKGIANHFKRAQYVYVCAIITAVIISLGIFRFPNFLGRFVEGCRDIGLSFAYAFCDFFDIKDGVLPSVNNLPDFDFLNAQTWFYSLFNAEVTPGINNPTTFIPSKWEVFVEKWELYWQAFAMKRFFTYTYITL